MRGLFVMVLLLFGTSPLMAQQTSPYAGQQHRPLKALSEAEIEGYLAGEGMGFARVAELNHYPGPRHVLDLADSRELASEQLRRIQELFETMHVEAVRLGTELVNREAAIARSFAEGRTDEDEMSKLLGQMGAIRAALMGVHLRAGIARLDELRGCTGEAEATDQSPAGHHHR